MDSNFRLFAIATLLGLGSTPSSGFCTTIVNDVTQLNPIGVDQVITPRSVDEIRQWVKKHRGPISIGGGRYSQGGQIATENALFLDMRGMDKILNLDVKKRQITVETGITWRKIQEAIDSENLSLRIMQTYSNFTVGGSLSVNVHGRYVGEGPLVRSVESIRIVLADGSLKDASRTQNPELFFGAIGGYGGIGVLVEATLNLTENTKIIRDPQRMKISSYKDYFIHSVRNSKTAVFHNADIYPPEYREVTAVTWNKTDQAVTVPDRLAPRDRLSSVEQFFLSWFSTGPFGKEIRQYLFDRYIYSEKRVEWRNYEASYDVIGLEPTSRQKSTYVLQEYFIPVEHFDEFATQMTQIFTQHHVNVLNVSIRHALPDPGTLLAWAREEVFSFVVYYHQGVTEKDKKEVSSWTSEMIEAALKWGGTYYLPYQIIATQEQFLRAYPSAPDYFTLKAKVDPTYKFRNKLWDHYYKSEKSIPPQKAPPEIRNERRPEEQTFYVIPEWYIVYSADEYAEVLKRGRPSQFPYFSSISQFWEVRRGALQKVVKNYPPNSGYQTMIGVIGVSFSVENILKGVYENTVGRVTEMIAASPRHLPPYTPEDRFLSQVAQDYARFIRDRPWYEFPFRDKLIGLWNMTDLSDCWIRSKERKLFGLIELSVKTLYSWIVQKGVSASYEAEDFYLQAKVSGFSQKLPDLKKIQVSLIRTQDHQQIIQVPRYEAFTRAVPILIHQGIQFHEIAGNQLIALTAVAPRNWTSKLKDGEVFLKWNILTDPLRNRIAIAVHVNKLNEILTQLESQNIQLDHIYDY